MLRKLETHHIVGTLSVFQGLSFLLEEYTFSTRALSTPLSLLDWVPFMSGQTAWGYLFVLIGAGTLASRNVYLRAVALAAGAMAWGILSVASLYESLFGTLARHSGSFVGLLSATILAATLRASAQLPNDFHPHHHREDDQQ
jgi:fucose 4-O-acetylase-like acetyltransferase